MQRRGQRRRDVLRCDADVGVVDVLATDELRKGVLRSVDWDSETYTAVVSAPGLAADLGVDADHAPTSVEERPAGVSVRDRRVRLDRVDDREPRDRQGGNRAVDAGDDADGQRVLVAERAPDGRDRLSDLNSGRLAERNGRQRMDMGVDLNEADVVVDVPADDRRPHAVE